MASKSEPIDYWALIEEACDKVDIYSGARTYLQQIAKYPVHVRHLLAAHWCQSEICNGGIDQLVLNSTGVLVPDGVEGLAAIGMPKTAAVLQKAIAKLGTPYPRSRPLRRQRWLALPKTSKAARRGLGEAFERLTDRFFDAMEADGGFDERANAYATQVTSAIKSPASKRRAQGARTKR